MRRALLLATSLFFAIGCGGPEEGKVNTLPSSDPVYGQMWTLATMADELDGLMKSEPVDGQAALTLLQRMEKVTVELRGSKKKHPVLQDNIDSFYDEVAQAVKGARAEPPNYYYAGKVSGACVYCHDPEGGVKKR